jgi:hypothetical protein
LRFFRANTACITTADDDDGEVCSGDDGCGWSWRGDGARA